ncbi:MAG: AraC family transcriptional regulator [Treponema sp.]|nr:AraC family transcriptional regulator [Treponema sp.]
MQKQRQIFASFSLSFLFFIIIPVLVFNIAIWLAIRVTGNNERQNMVVRLSESSGRMDIWIRDIQNMVTRLRRNEQIRALERMDSSEDAEYFTVWLAIQSLLRMDIPTQGLDIMVFCQNTGRVLSPGFLAGNMSEAWGSSFQFGDYDYSGFLDYFCFSGFRPVFFPGMDTIWENTPHRGMLYGMRLDVNSEMYTFSLLREQRIREHFSPVFSGGGALYIYDASGSVLISLGGGFPAEQLDPALFAGNGLLPDGFWGPGIIGAYSHSDHGLFYVSALSTEAALYNVQRLWNITVIINITAIFLTLGYAVFLAAWNTKQVGEAFQLLSKAPGFSSYEKGNALRYLNNSVKQLVSANVRFRKDADSRYEILKVAYIDRLLNDEWETPQKAAALAEYAGISVTGRRFCVILLVIGAKKIDEVNATETYHRIHDILEKTLPADEAVMYNRNPGRIGIFLFLKPEHWADYKKYLENIFQNTVIPDITEHYKLIGSPLYEDIFEIREAYQLCREYALIHDNLEDRHLYWIDPILPLLHQQMIFSFPLEVEQKLINQLRCADFENARNLIQAVFNANVREIRLSERMLMIFYANLQGSFLKSLEGSLADFWRDAIEDLDFNYLPQEMEEIFIELARSICSSSHAELSKKNFFIKKEDLVAWVEEHFSEERLSLGLAARHFGFSESYFSQMFKEITGENFSVFAEQTRLNHARLLLRQHLKIEEVAYRCGYSSANSFRRAYKRHFGINPARTPPN